MNAFRTDMERAVTSLGFSLAVIGTMLALFAGCFTGLSVDMEVVHKEGLSYGYHLGLLYRGLRSEAFTFALPVLATLGYGGAYLEEMKSGYYKFAIPRYGRRTYVISKILAGILSGGLSVWLGYIFAAVLEWIIYAPMEKDAETAILAGDVVEVREAFVQGAIRLVDGSMYQVTPEQAAHSNMFVALLQWSALVFLIGAVWAALANLFAILYRNRYMAYGASFLISYLVIILISRFFQKIYIFNPREWFTQLGYWEGGNLGVLLFLLECMIALGIIDGIVMSRKLEAV